MGIRVNVTHWASEVPRPNASKMAQCSSQWQFTVASLWAGAAQELLSSCKAYSSVREFPIWIEPANFKLKLRTLNNQWSSKVWYKAGVSRMESAELCQRSNCQPKVKFGDFKKYSFQNMPINWGNSLSGRHCSSCRIFCLFDCKDQCFKLKLSTWTRFRSTSLFSGDSLDARASSSY